MQFPNMQVEFVDMFDGKKTKGTLAFNEYVEGNLAVQLYDDEGPYATLSVNVEGIELDDDEFVAKTYSENTGLVEQFIEQEQFVDTGKTVTVGYAAGQPILKVSNNFG